MKRRFLFPICVEQWNHVQTCGGGDFAVLRGTRRRQGSDFHVWLAGGLGGGVLTSFKIREFVLSMLLFLPGFPVCLCLPVIRSVLMVAGRALRALMKDLVHLIL